MRRIGDDTFRMIADALRARRPLTEFDVQQFVLRAFDAEGLETESAPICSVDGNAAEPHYAPTADSHAAIREGNVVLLDYWARRKGGDFTYVDLTNMAYAGSALPPKVARVWDAVRGARDAAVALVAKRLGARMPLFGWEVDDASREVIRTAGFGEQFVHRTGHSIDTAVHGRGTNIDNYETRDERPILPRTSFSIEPGIYLKGEFGIRSEIDVLVLADGTPIVPSEPSQTLPALLIG
jgi:Xaa-Pro aminopeptidase